MTYRFLIRLVIPFIYALAALSSLSLLTLAQAPSPFEMSLIPQNESAVAGDLFTYTVVITNVSQPPVQDFTFINIKIPDGMKFVNTRHSSRKWYGGNPYPDPDFKVDQITLHTSEAIEFNEVFAFEMIVEVLPEVDQPIVIEEYGVTTAEGEALASGSPIQIQVLSPTPGPTSLDSPTPTVSVTPPPTLTAIPASFPTPQANRDADTPTPGPTVVALADAGVVDATPTPIVAEAPPETVENSSSFSPMWAIGGAVLALILIGLVWFLRAK